MTRLAEAGAFGALPPSAVILFARSIPAGASEASHPYAAIEQACEIAQTHGAYRLRSIRELIKRTAPRQNQFEFIEQHPIIRGIHEYGALVRHALQQEPGPRTFPGEEPAPQVLPQTPTPWASFPSPVIGELV